MVNVKKRYFERSKYHEKMESKENDIKKKKYYRKLKEWYQHLAEKEK